MKRLLMVDDDAYLSSTVRSLLEPHGFGVETAPNAQDGFRSISENAPDLLILDLGLPDEDGISLCQRIRAKWSFPILMLTSRTDLVDKVLGLEVGADDYLTKPFEGRELIARVRACLRRTTQYQAPEPQTLRVGPMTILTDEMRVSVGENRITLTALEYRLLAHMAENVDRVLPRSRLFETVWGFEDEFNSNSLDVFVYRLRHKLESAGAVGLIHTVRGVGYRMGLSD